MVRPQRLRHRLPKVFGALLEVQKQTISPGPSAIGVKLRICGADWEYEVRTQILELMLRYIRPNDAELHVLGDDSLNRFRGHATCIKTMFMYTCSHVLVSTNPSLNPKLLN